MNNRFVQFCFFKTLKLYEFALDIIIFIIMIKHKPLKWINRLVVGQVVLIK